MLFRIPGRLKIMENIMVYVGENTLERVETFKYLGAMLDPQLTFKAHCEYVKSKTLGKVRALGRIRNFVGHETAV